MSATEIVTFAGIMILVIATQVGRRQLSLHRFLIPLAVTAFVAQHYLQGIPTVGGDLNFELALGAAGVVLGVLAGLLVRVERDGPTGRLVTEAGLAYAALWVLVFGGRMAFAWGATHLWTHQIWQFSFQHEITGTAAWTAAFVLMAIAMVAARTIVVAIKALLAAPVRPGLLQIEA